MMMWTYEIKVTSSEIHRNYIDIRIDENSASGWRFTGLYGEPRGDRKHLTWDYLRGLQAMVDLPWVVAGDFNEILQAREKEGGLHVPSDACKHLAVLCAIVSSMILASVVFHTHIITGRMVTAMCKYVLIVQVRMNRGESCFQLLGLCT